MNLELIYNKLEELRQLIKSNKQAESLVYKISLLLEECNNDE